LFLNTLKKIQTRQKEDDMWFYLGCAMLGVSTYFRFFSETPDVALSAWYLALGVLAFHFDHDHGKGK